MSKADPLVPRVLGRGSAAFQLLWLRVRIPLETWMSVSSECYVLFGKGICDGPISRIEEPYRVWADALFTLYLQWVGRKCQTEKEGIMTKYRGVKRV